MRSERIIKPKEMGKRVRITNDSVNSYGSRVLTEGLDIEQYKKNPVLLYMHRRGEVIGYMKDVRKENGEVTGEPVFDEATELSRSCKQQWEFGSLKMVSAGIDILATSEEPKYLTVGQTAATITESKLYEVSLVDVGANDDALVLMREGKQITMGRDGENPLPSIKIKTMAKEKKEEKAAVMELEAAQVQAVKAVQEKEAPELEKENAELKKEIAELKERSLLEMVNRAIEEGRIEESRREQFMELGRKVGEKSLSEVFGAMQRRVKIADMVRAGRGEGPEEESLGKMSEKEIAEMRKDNKERYIRLYKKEYGMEPDMDYE